MRWWHYFVRERCTCPSPKRSKRAFNVENNRNQTVCMCVIWNNKFESSLTDVQPIWLLVVMVCVSECFSALHLISVTLVLRLILWWFCDRIYKCGSAFFPPGGYVTRDVEAVVLQTVTAVMMAENMRVHFYCGMASDATTMPTKAVVDGCEKC